MSAVDDSENRKPDSIKAGRSLSSILPWLGTVVGLAGFIFLGIRSISSGGDRALGFILSIVAVLAITVLVVAYFALSIAARMRDAGERLPGALLVPVVVGSDTATAIDRLAVLMKDPSLRLRSLSYATLGFSASGMHVVVRPGDSWGVIPGAQVAFARFGRTLVGSRLMDAIVLRVDATLEVIELQLVPMRLRGNPFRALRQRELEAVVKRIEAALSGSIDPGWTY